MRPRRRGGLDRRVRYLQEFVEPGVPWAHPDVMACLRSRPGRPEGPKPPHCGPSTPTSPKGLVSPHGQIALLPNLDSRFVAGANI
jgi:hypothetical protein